MGTILSLLLGLVNPVGQIVKQIAAERERRLTLEGTAAKIESDERVAVLEAHRDLLIARGGNKIDALVRAMFAVPVAIYCGKLYLWDKVLAMGATDPLSPWLSEIALLIIGGYFLHSTATRVLRK